MIQVTMVAANTYQVAVDGREREPSLHLVSLSQEYYRHLSAGTVTHEWVIVQAFQFLLKRMPNTAIGEALDLADVAARFDDFESEVAQRLGRQSP